MVFFGCIMNLKVIFHIFETPLHFILVVLLYDIVNVSWLHEAEDFLKSKKLEQIEQLVFLEFLRTLSICGHKIMKRNDCKQIANKPASIYMEGNWL